MSQKHLVKYGEAVTIDFALFEADGVDFRTDAVHAAGDTVISKDQAAEANTANGFTDEGTGYAILFTAAEMTCKRAIIYIVDQTATKAWLDEYIIIETYGHASAMHAFNLDYDFSGNNEDIKMKSLSLISSDGVPLTILSNSTDDEAVNIKGNGAGEGMIIEGGATGRGLHVKGGSTSGDAAYFIAAGGKGLYCIGGGSDAAGIKALGGANSHGLECTANGIGSGIIASSPGSSGIKSTAGGNFHGLHLIGAGSGDGINIVAGSTGNGIAIAGGSTSGKGIDISTINGHGIEIDATTGSGNNAIKAFSASSALHCRGEGDNQAGIIAEGGNNGTGLICAGGIGGPNPGTGAKFSSGIGGNGIDIIAAGAANGINITTSDGHGISSVATGSSKHGLYLKATTGNGLHAESASGNGVDAIGNGTGVGMSLSSLGTNKEGLSCAGNGSGPGAVFQGGASGNGADFIAGSTGNGIDISTTDGHGINISAVGANKHAFYAASGGGIGAYLVGGGANPGLYAKGGVSGDGAIFQGGTTTGDGYRAMASGGNGNGASFHKNGIGKDIDADELGNGISLTDIVDGTVTVAEFYEDLLAWMKGKSQRNTPNDGDLRFFKQDETTPAFTVHVTDTERTEV